MNEGAKINIIGRDIIKDQRYNNSLITTPFEDMKNENFENFMVSLNRLPIWRLSKSAALVDVIMTFPSFFQPSCLPRV